MKGMTKMRTIGPVTLTMDSAHQHAVEGHCVDCLHTFVAFGEIAGETMARRHVVLAHPDVELPPTTLTTGGQA